MNRHTYHGKRTDNGEWVTGGYCVIPHPPVCFREDLEHVDPDKHCIVCETPNTLADWGMPRQMCMIDIDPATIGQCTGLLAAKSYRGDSEDARTVFEGDVLSCNCHDRKSDCFPPKKVEKIAQIEWWSSHCNHGYRLRFAGGGTMMVAQSALSTMEVEIIGNIWEHPTLLGTEGGTE